MESCFIANHIYRKYSNMNNTPYKRTIHNPLYCLYLPKKINKEYYIPKIVIKDTIGKDIITKIDYDKFIKINNLENNEKITFEKEGVLVQIRKYDNKPVNKNIILKIEKWTNANKYKIINL